MAGEKIPKEAKSAAICRWNCLTCKDFSLHEEANRIHFFIIILLIPRNMKFCNFFISFWKKWIKQKLEWKLSNFRVYISVCRAKKNWRFSVGRAKIEFYWNENGAKQVNKFLSRRWKLEFANLEHFFPLLFFSLTRLARSSKESSLLSLNSGRFRTSRSRRETPLRLPTVPVTEEYVQSLRNSWVRQCDK